MHPHRLADPRHPPRRAPITAAVREEMTGAARAFLAERYGLDERQRALLAVIPVVWRTGAPRLRARYCAGPGDGCAGRHIRIRVPRGDTSRWHTYDRVHARLTTPPSGLAIPLRLHLTLTLVHEYTHALQDGIADGRRHRFLEAETTRNEIAYLERHAPGLLVHLVPAQGAAAARRRRAASRTVPTTPPRPTPGRRPVPPPLLVTRVVRRMRRGRKR